MELRPLSDRIARATPPHRLCDMAHDYMAHDLIALALELEHHEAGLGRPRGRPLAARPTAGPQRRAKRAAPDNRGGLSHWQLMAARASLRFDLDVSAEWTNDECRG
jgi:hypothetical protein